jgi:uncharacterized membrane protein
MYAPPDLYIPQTLADRRPLMVWFIVAAAALLFIALIVGAPLALAEGHGLLALTIYQAFSYLCHQIPERSFFIAGHKLAVCTRCTGLYAGFAIAVFLYPAVRSLRSTYPPQRKWLFIAAAPTAIDFMLGFFGIWDNTHLSRFSTGALLGTVAVFYVMPGLAELSLRNWLLLFGRSKQGSEDRAAHATVLSNGTSVAQSDYSAPHRRI